MGGAAEKTAYGASLVSMGVTLGPYAQAMISLLSPNFGGICKLGSPPKMVVICILRCSLVIAVAIIIAFSAVIILPKQINNVCHQPIPYNTDNA